jgi:hypothetical protein
MMQVPNISSSDRRLHATGYPLREAQPAPACTAALLWVAMAAIIAISVFVCLSRQIPGVRQNFGGYRR